MPVLRPLFHCFAMDWFSSLLAAVAVHVLLFPSLGSASYEGSRPAKDPDLREKAHFKGRNDVSIA